jgi:glycine/D-amino acid oxidase-like deaminating enzyme
MPNLLPTLFIALAALALVLTLLWLWQSLRLALVRASGVESSRNLVSPERAALLAEKQGLLVALRDLESERDAGKLSADDFAELNKQYRERARAVLRELDALLEPHRTTARALLAAAASGAVVVAERVNDTDKVIASAAHVNGSEKPANDRGAHTTDACSGCGTLNDLDAVFCKKCGARLRSERSA